MSDTRLTLRDAIQRLVARSSLSTEEARGVMTSLLGGDAPPSQTGAFLVGLRMKGETEDEIVGLVEALRSAGVRISPAREPLVDLCGTGGDGSGTFNISTAASLVVAGAGVAVAKHGNRSASSRCGSADVLEALGVPIDLAPERARVSIEEHGFAFLFAQLYHPALKHLAGVRKDLGIRTVLNSLGPLLSPAGVKRQLVGVADGASRRMIASVLRTLGSTSAWVVHGAGGLDEVSPAGESVVTAVSGEGGEGVSLRDFSLSPEDGGLVSGSLDALRGGDAAANRVIIEGVLSGARGPRRDAVLLNAAAALVVSGAARDLREGVGRAAESLDSGAAKRVLEAVRRFR